VADVNAIRILADDLTGALDTAAAFAGEVPVFIDRPPVESGGLATAPVSVVATPTRDVALEELPGFLWPVLAWLKSGGLAFKKVDSLLRGNSFAEVAWIARAGGFDLTVFAPAFPAQGRMTYDGQQWVVEPGNLSGLGKPAGIPFAEAFGRFGLNASAALPSVGGELDVWAPDIGSDADLDAVVAVIARDDPRSRLWCGSAGLAHALARCRGISPGSVEASPLAADNGATVLVSASHHPVLRGQWAVLRAGLQAQALAEQACEAELVSALEQVRRGARDAWFDLSPQDKVSPERAAQLLSAHASQLVAGLPKPAQLIVVGGDTLLGLCRAAGVQVLLAQPAVRPGWGCARLQGGAWDGVPCYSRSGAFGGADDLLAMIRLLKGSDNSRKGN